jgi:hypothetical protein
MVFTENAPVWSGMTDAAGQIHQMKVVLLGLAHKTYGDVRDKCTCLVGKYEDNTTACLKDHVV